MTSLILMYVYYDNAGDIKAITPIPDPELNTGFNSITFPISELVGFLTGQKNPFDYIIKKVKKINKDSFIIAKKEKNVQITRTLDNYLSKVNDDPLDTPILQIVAQQWDKHIYLSLHQDYKELYKTGFDDEKEDVASFLDNDSSTLYFTLKNDPYTLIQTVIFSPRVLFDEPRIAIPYGENVDLSYSSVYTKKIINSYGYKIRGIKNGVRIDE